MKYFSFLLKICNPSKAKLMQDNMTKNTVEVERKFLLAFDKSVYKNYNEC